jgi:hypothetical protein
MCKITLTSDEVEQALIAFVQKKRGKGRTVVNQIVWRELTPTLRVLDIDYSLPDAIDVQWSEVAQLRSVA